MEPFTIFNTSAAALSLDNVGTDAIMPSLEILGIGNTGLADGLYCRLALRCARQSRTRSGLRFQRSRQGARKICFRAIIVPSFNPIFQGNCVRNVVSPVELADSFVACLATTLSGTVAIVLVRCEVQEDGGAAHRFVMSEEARRTLLLGADPIALPLLRRSEIDAFMAKDLVGRPWIYPARG